MLRSVAMDVHIELLITLNLIVFFMQLSTGITFIKEHFYHCSLSECVKSGHKFLDILYTAY